MRVPTHYLKKRDFLWSPKVPPETLSAAGNEFFAGEFYSEALDFFERARDEEGVRKIKKVALAKGDTFLLARLERYDRRMVEPQDWEEAARIAERTERGSMAAYARRRLAPPESPAAPTVAPGEAPLEESAPSAGAAPAAPK